MLEPKASAIQSLRSAVSGVTLLLASSTLLAGPFDDCPSEAFLIQNQIAEIYGVQLATGYYSLLSSDMGTLNKVNAVGFSFHDNYLYGWSYESKTVARIGSDYQLEPLNVQNVPNTSFYVGDVALDDNAYYMYRNGYGLYRIGLDSNGADYLQVSQMVDDAALNLRIYDMAFHPDNGWIYSVDAKGTLYRFNAEGFKENLGSTGETGTFGAVYFDVDGNLYISRNNDGHVFRIQPDSASPSAELFAYGPSSSNNDGARCAMAPVISVDASTVDFGDAPASYGTQSADNGARHDISAGLLYLGNNVTGEPDANGLGTDSDDDGVQFLTDLAVGEAAFIKVTSTAPGYLNAWIDFDNDGQFDADEQVAVSRSIAAGENTFRYLIPQWAEPAETWARFRVSSESNLGATGGVSDGEVEDYSITIIENNTVVTHYPSQAGWATLAFEDNWPLVGDYDFTDLVVNYRIAQYRLVDPATGLSTYSKVKIEGQIAAVGASFHNGFAFHLPGIERDQVNEDAIRFVVNNRNLDSPMEIGRKNAIVVVANDVWDFVTAGEACKYHRTEPGCGSAIQMRFSIVIPFDSSNRPSSLPPLPYDPFIFASENYERNYVFGMAPGRAYELHMKGMAPTEAGRVDFLTRGEDASNVANGEYYQTAEGMPWVINVGEEWRYPLEYMDVIYAYPKFQDYVQSGGIEASDWYSETNAVLKNTFSN